MVVIDPAGLDPGGLVAGTLAEGLTLPAAWYGDQTVLEREHERVFATAWQYAGPASLVSEREQCFACSAGHLTIVVARGPDGTLRAFVSLGSSLLPARVEVWGPLVFVNPDPDAPAFADTVPELSSLVERSGVDLSSLELRVRREWESPAHWKLGVENYLECYHCPVAHPGFSRVVDVHPDRYVLRTFERFSSQLAPVRRPRALDGGSEPPYDAGGEVTQPQFHFLWPNTGLNIYPGRANLAVMVWLPSSPRRTRGRTEYFFARDVPEESARELVSFSRQVGEEDVGLVESVQRGLDSGMLPHGHLLASSEHLIQHFQRLLYDALA